MTLGLILNGPATLTDSPVRAPKSKPVIRATNNGITAVIDKNGIVVDKLPQFLRMSFIDGNFTQVERHTAIWVTGRFYCYFPRLLMCLESFKSPLTGAHFLKKVSQVYACFWY